MGFKNGLQIALLLKDKGGDVKAVVKALKKDTQDNAEEDDQIKSWRRDKSINNQAIRSELVIKRECPQ